MDLEKLRELRLAKGLSQMKTAKLVGVSLNAYIKWENGVGKPNEENYKKLESVLIG